MQKPPIYQFSLARDQTKDNRIKYLRQAYKLHHEKGKNRHVSSFIIELKMERVGTPTLTASMPKAVFTISKQLEHNLSTSMNPLNYIPQNSCGKMKMATMSLQLC